ncbi:MAG: hypothetical protein ABIJ26_07950 [Candidatus Margulisiibacteriota bacterium]
MLYFVFTVDGDWSQYYDPALSEEKRRPSLQKLVDYVKEEIKVTEALKGKFVHFIHTSPRARDFFLRREFVTLFRQIMDFQGSLGIHCHEDDPRKEYFYADQKRMREVIGFFCEALSENRLKASAYRGGYLAFSPLTIPVLEENHIFLDFSCEPGRYLMHGSNLVSDWRGAPDNFYRLDYQDHRRRGSSNVFEIPVGIYVENLSLAKIQSKAKKLKEKAENSNIIVSVLTHSFNFGNFFERRKIVKALKILKQYGTFINAEEAHSKIVEEEKR